MCIQVYYTVGIIQEVVRARKMYFVLVSEQRPWGIGTGSRPIRGYLLLCVLCWTAPLTSMAAAFQNVATVWLQAS